MTALRRTRPTAASFADLCGWKLLAGNGIIQMQSGDYLAGFWSSPGDRSGLELSEREAVCQRLGDAFSVFGSGWALWTDVAVVPTTAYLPPATFPCAAAQAVDDERREHFTTPGVHTTRDQILTVSWRPESVLAGKAAEAMYEDDPEHRPSPVDRALSEFEATLEEFEVRAARDLGLRRMRTYTVAQEDGTEVTQDELVSYLAYTVDGVPGVLSLPPGGGFLDAAIGGVDWWPGSPLRLDKDWVSVVAIDGFPAQSMPGILDHLGGLGFPMRFSQRFLPLDPDDAVKEIKVHRREWHQLTVNALLGAMGIKSAAPNQHAIDNVAEVDRALGIAQARRLRFGYYNGAVVLRHEDRETLAVWERLVREAIRACEYKARVETINLPEAFLATLPGHQDENLRRPPAHTRNLADTAPTSQPWTGSPENPNPLLPPGTPALLVGTTEGAQPFFGNIHTGDNGNHAGFGPPGSGKTSLMNLMSMQHLRWPGAANRGIDVKGGMIVPCSAAGGRWREVGGEEPAFAPFRHLETESDRGWSASFVAQCYALQKNQVLPEPPQRTAIRQTLEAMRTLEPHLRTLSNFVTMVQDAAVRDAMAVYAGGLLDAAEEAEDGGTWEVFDVTHILHAGDDILLPATLAMLRRFERGITGRPQLWSMDEVAVQIAAPHWRPRLRSMLKLFRSRKVAVGIWTQNLSDVAARGLFDIVMENVPLHLFGANPKAQEGAVEDVRGPADFYEAFGLGPAKREIVRRLMPKAEFYWRQGEHGRRVDFTLGPKGKALCAATDTDNDVPAAKAILRQTGPGEKFLRAWLEHKRVRQ